MKRTALIAGVSIATLACVGSVTVQASPVSAESWWNGSRASSPYDAPSRKSLKARARASEKAERRDSKKGREAEKAPPLAGPLHVIVSIAKQRATLFDDGVPVASTAVSTGTPGHPTPMGVFTIIQKSRHHVSNLYNASMPYMQRITWSGSALHQGPLPGYPASHGCVRLTETFAQLLWKSTKMGARVIITRDEVAPMTIEHVRLFVPRPPKLADAPAVTSGLVKTADATSATVAEQPAKKSVTDGIGGTPDVPKQAVEAAKPAEAPEPATQAAEAEKSAETQVPEPSLADTKVAETKFAEAKPSEVKPAMTPAAPAPIIVDERPATMPAAVVKEASRRPISVFVSLKEGKLYVRQGWQPMFETPVTFEHPDQPIGTHVYTAMGTKADGSGLRWTVVSIPSGTKRTVEPAKASANNRKPRNDRTVKTIEVVMPVPSASSALDRLVMPPEAVERISELMMAGSSLIVSDNKLSDETGAYTDFIVLTR